MRELSFVKMHGLGNSYIYLDLFKHPLESDFDFPRLAQFISNPHTGIGSDGLILITPSDIADAKMRIFNKDGSEGKNCGNGLRCVAKYLHENSYVSRTAMTIETARGIVKASMVSPPLLPSIVTVAMGRPHFRRSEIPMAGLDTPYVLQEPFEIQEHSLSLTALSVGNPHAIFFIDHSETTLHTQLGPSIERDPRFPEGINVEFIHLLSPTLLRCHVWERGSGATQACGTGACASVVAAVLTGRCRAGEEVTVRLEGGDVSVTWQTDGEILMTGPAAHIASGTFRFPSPEY